ncbi:MAG: response regulator [Paracoccaceae bacterium]
MRILAVDDEPSILELLKTFLEAGEVHEVVTATSGAQALSIIDAAEYDFDCMLLDIQMPEMNGITLCENIRALPDYFHVPIIMLTAMSQKTYIEKAFSVGATDYVTKPFDFLELRGRLTSAAKIMFEYNRACDNAERARRLLIDTGMESKPHPDEPLSITDVERVVGYSAFENYVMALSFTKLLFLSAFAVKIVDFKGLHEAVSSREVRSILHTVAQVIVDNLPGQGNLVSYRGNGVFLCINQRNSAIPSAQRVIQMTQALAQRKAMTLGKTDFNVAVGAEMAMVSISKSGALMALRKAVDSIEHQPPVAVKELSDLSKRVLRNQSRTQEQANLERRTYELVLEDIVREENRHVR